MKNIDNAPEFILRAPFMTDLLMEIKGLKAELEELKNKLNPKQELFDLKEACALKGLSYGSLASQKYKHLQPNGGKPDVMACGRSRWRYETVQKWLTQSDEELEKVFFQSK